MQDESRAKRLTKSSPETASDKSIYIHESSYVDLPCKIGENTKILHYSHIMAHAIIGSFCEIGRNVIIESGVILGNYVQVMNNTQINSGVILEDSVYCGSSVVFAESNRVRAMPCTVSKVSPTLVKQGASISANTTIASGNTVGQYAFIEAGSIIDRNIPDFAIAYGNPVKFIGWRCKCGQSLQWEKTETTVQCPYCARQFERQSQWKIVPLIDRDLIVDSYSRPQTTVQPSQRTG